jgi:hypothetical protein
MDVMASVGEAPQNLFFEKRPILPASSGDQPCSQLDEVAVGIVRLLAKYARRNHRP